MTLQDIADINAVAVWPYTQAELDVMAARFDLSRFEANRIKNGSAFDNGANFMCEASHAVLAEIMVCIVSAREHDATPRRSFVACLYVPDRRIYDAAELGEAKLRLDHTFAFDTSAEALEFLVCMQAQALALACL